MKPKIFDNGSMQFENSTKQFKKFSRAYASRMQLFL